jgi:hypothetical protein
MENPGDLLAAGADEQSGALDVDACPSRHSGRCAA